MVFFSRTQAKNRIGALIEIGSGSVLGSIVISDHSKRQPTIVWSKREFAILSADYDFARSLKSLLTTLMNVIMAIDTEGRSALREVTKAEIDTLQISISAPWAYTISKVIEYETDEPFTITTALIDSLIEKANERTMEVLRQSEAEQHAGLTIMTRATTDVTANGYHTMTPIGQKASVVTLTQVSAIAQNLITGALDDLRLKVFPKASLERYSSMLVFHSTIKELYPEMTEYCLVDLTYEATEIAIIRDGVLQYTTHTHIGVNTLIRNLALRLNTPEGDATTIFKRLYDTDTLETLTEKERSTMSTLLAEYQEALEALFHETGDSLSIPKILFLHGNYIQERFFDDYITAAAKAATSSSHTVHTLTHELMLSRFTGDSKISILKRNIDTAGLMAAQFFHKQVDEATFTQV